MTPISRNGSIKRRLNLDNEDEETIPITVKIMTSVGKHDESGEYFSRIKFIIEPNNVVLGPFNDPDTAQQAGEEMARDMGQQISAQSGIFLGNTTGGVKH